MAWVTVLIVVCSMLVGGAVLRVAGGVFYGLGDPPGEDPEMAKEAAEETSETDAGKRRTPLTMIVPPALLVAAASASGHAAEARTGGRRPQRSGSRTRPRTTRPC